MSPTSTRPRHTLTQVARAYVSILSRMESAELAAYRAELQPYKRAHLAACWEAGWLAYGASIQLGEGVTSPELGRQARAAWLKGHQARQALTQSNNHRSKS